MELLVSKLYWILVGVVMGELILMVLGITIHLLKLVIKELK